MLWDWIDNFFVCLFFTLVCQIKAMSGFHGNGKYGNKSNGYNNRWNTNSAASHAQEHRDLLRFMYQTSAKGRGKSFQTWNDQWKACMARSQHVQANSVEGGFSALKSKEFCCWISLK